jgi:hypothetical protein
MLELAHPRAEARLILRKLGHQALRVLVRRLLLADSRAHQLERLRDRSAPFRLAPASCHSARGFESMHGLQSAIAVDASDCGSAPLVVTALGRVIGRSHSVSDPRSVEFGPRITTPNTHAAKGVYPAEAAPSGKRALEPNATTFLDRVSEQLPSSTERRYRFGSML